MRTRLVVKLIAVLVLLLAVVLYKLNDYFKQEKVSQAESLVKKQMQTLKTSVASQITAVRNVVSSYETEIKETNLNWIQLDPFFGVARLEKRSDGSFHVLQYVGRSGSLGERWTADYVEKALAAKKKSSTDTPTEVRLFSDRAGGKYITLLFKTQNNQRTAVFGSAEYFQKFFDAERGGRMTSALMTQDHILTAHTESEYIATLSDEAELSAKTYILEKQSLGGTNLLAVVYTPRKAAAASWMIPWSMVGLICGFGFVIIGLLYYGLDPLDRKIERYKKQERENVFNEVVRSSQMAKPKNGTPAAEQEKHDVQLAVEARIDTVEKAQQAFAEPEVQITEATLGGPLQQALFNLDSICRQSGIEVEKNISTRLQHHIHYGPFLKAFENILRNSIEALEGVDEKKISVRAYDIEGEVTVIEIQDNGVGLGALKGEIEKIWQPFFSTKPKASHMGLGLTEALSIFRRCHGDLSIESLPEGVLVKMILRKDAAQEKPVEAPTADTELTKTGLFPLQDTPTLEIDEDFEQDPMVASAVFTSVKPAATEDDLDLDRVLSLDDDEAADMFTSNKVKIEADKAPLVAQTQTQTQAAAQAQAPAAPAKLRTPQFALGRKNFEVDQIETTIRRPTRS